MAKELGQQMIPKVTSRSFAADKLSLEKAIRPSANNTKIIDNACFFNGIKIKFVLTFFLIIIVIIWRNGKS